jgi:hypothetical protein
MPAAQHVAKVQIIPILNANNKTIAAAERSSAQASRLDRTGTSSAQPGILRTSPNSVWSANQIARLRMTPTTAAVIEESAAVSALLPRSASL